GVRPSQKPRNNAIYTARKAAHALLIHATGSPARTQRKPVGIFGGGMPPPGGAQSRAREVPAKLLQAERTRCPEYQYQGERMYQRPTIERYGSLRDLTQLGAGADCDGGIFGINGSAGDGSSMFCSRNRS